MQDYTKTKMMDGYGQMMKTGSREIMFKSTGRDAK